MTAGGGRKGRALSGEETSLWEAVTRSVRPMRKRASRLAPPKEAEAGPTPPPRQRGAVSPALPPAAMAKAPPAPAPLERRLKQKIARGSLPIDGRIDLHGHTQTQAHDALLRFLRTMQARGGSVALVITGKGGRGADGVLKRAVPLWLALPEFRALVIGFDAASAAHGGDGALYVRIRKKR